MGAELGGADWSNQDRQRYREKVGQDLDVLERMLASHQFDAHAPTTGFEVEMSLVDEQMRPCRRNAEVIAALDDESFVPELGRFNVELNVEPRVLVGDKGLETSWRTNSPSGCSGSASRVPHWAAPPPRSASCPHFCRRTSARAG